jgi:hypothetical protein
MRVQTQRLTAVIAELAKDMAQELDADLAAESRVCEHIGAHGRCPSGDGVDILPSRCFAASSRNGTSPRPAASTTPSGRTPRTPGSLQCWHGNTSLCVCSNPNADGDARSGICKVHGRCLKKGSCRARPFIE